MTLVGMLVTEYAPEESEYNKSFLYNIEVLQLYFNTLFTPGKDEQYWYYLEFYKIFKANKMIPKEKLKDYEMLLNDLFQ